MLIGGGFGAVAARKVRMTAMPQMVALFNGVGGGAAALIALAELHRILPPPGHPKDDISTAIALSGADRLDLVRRLDGRVREAPGADRRPADHVPRPAVRQRRALPRRARLRDRSRGGRAGEWLLWVIVPRSSHFGVLFVLPIGGADMPVVISLLNAFTGLAVAIGGFELENNVLIVAGMLVGASGTLLTLLMGRAMNRSIANVLFGAFGQVTVEAAAVAAGDGGTVRSANAEDVAVMLAYAHKVVFVPGYGLAVAQAQHDVRQLADLLESKGVEVSYAIHPVAGRMPGHMNVLLAEANVPYPQLKEMDEANPEFSRTDVAVVVGANDVVNPDAREPGLADLRHADPQRRRRASRRRPQAVDEPGLRRDREPALLQPEDRDAVRRRQGIDHQARRRRQEPLSSVRPDGFSNLAYEKRAGSSSSSWGDSRPRIASATSSPQAKPSTLPWPE